MKRPRVEQLAGAALILAALALSAGYAYYRSFSRFQSYDDEGFILISLKSFLQGKALYDAVYSCYQPGFYIIQGFLFGICGIPVSHEGIRFFTIGFWLLGGGLNGLVTYRLTGNILLGGLVLLLSVRCLDSFANEPGHPQALAYLMVIGIVAIFTVPDSLPPAIAGLGLGVLLGFLFLIKVNVGAFVLLPSALVLLCGKRECCKTDAVDQWYRRFMGSTLVWCKLAIGLAMLALPAALMHGSLQGKDSPVTALVLLAFLILLALTSWLVRSRPTLLSAVAVFLLFAGTVPFVKSVTTGSLAFFSVALLTLSACTGVLVCLAEPMPQSGNRTAVWAVLGGGLAFVAVIGVTLLRGTTVQGLENGLFWWPLQQSTSYFFRWRSNSLGVYLGLLGLATCYGYLRWRDSLIGRHWFAPTLAMLKLAFGASVLTELLLRSPDGRLAPLHYSLPHFWMLPFAWLAAAADLNPRSNRLGRTALVGITVTQPLIAYPIAGTQLVPASILLAIVAAVCVADAVQFLRRKIPVRTMPWLRLTSSAVAGMVLLGAFGLELRAQATNYAALTALNLPGTAHVKLPAEQVGIYQAVVEQLARPEVRTFLTLPGMNSFYFWAKKDPPTSLNATAWMTMLDASAQERVWQAAQTNRGVVVVRNLRLAARWMRGRPLEQSPLVRHIEENFTPVSTNGTYELMVRR